MIGVRSSCDRLSMNSARIRCSRRSSATSSRTSQTPRIGERRARTTRVAPGRWSGSLVGEIHLAAGPAGLARLAGDRLDAVVAERLDRRPPDHRARLAPQEHVGRGVGDLDPKVVAEPDDPDPDEVREVGRGRGAAGRARTRRRRLGVGAVAVDRSGRRRRPPGACGAGAPDRCRARRRGRSASRSDSSIASSVRPARPRDPERDRERDRLDRHERDDEPIHRREHRTRAP